MLKMGWILSAAVLVACSRSDDPVGAPAARVNAGLATADAGGTTASQPSRPAGGSPAPPATGQADKTLTELTNACGPADLAACASAAKRLRSGKASEDDLRHADAYDCRAGNAERCAVVAARTKADCDAAKVQGCADLADLLQRGAGLPKDAAAARGLYEKVCKDRKYQESYLACLALGKMWRAGEGGPADLARAAQYKRLAETKFSNMMAKMQGMPPGSLHYSLRDAK